MPATNVETVRCEEVAELVAEQSVDLIDVRTPVEFRSVHASPARNVPLDALDPDAVVQSRRDESGAPIFVICQSGSRAEKACQAFLAAGHSNVVNVEGGTRAWEAAGLPVERGKAAMSLERQVRIAAGLLVVIGVSLGYFVHEGFLGLAAFVGAGLVFAGITDTCGMGMLIARMPWNNVSSTCETSCETTTKHPG